LRWRVGVRPARRDRRERSSDGREQRAEPDDVVERGGEREGPVDALAAAMMQFVSSISNRSLRIEYRR